MTVVEFLESNMDNIKMYKEIIPFMDKLGNTIEELENVTEYNVGDYNLYFRDRLYGALKLVGVEFFDDSYMSLMELYEVFKWLETVEYVVEDFDIQINNIGGGNFWLFSENIDNIDNFKPFYSGLDKSISYDKEAKDAYLRISSKLTFSHKTLLSLYSDDATFDGIFEYLLSIDYEFKNNIEFTEAVAIISVMVEPAPENFMYRKNILSRSLFSELV